MLEQNIVDFHFVEEKISPVLVHLMDITNMDDYRIEAVTVSSVIISRFRFPLHPFIPSSSFLEKHYLSISGLCSILFILSIVEECERRVQRQRVSVSSFHPHRYSLHFCLEAVKDMGSEMCLLPKTIISLPCLWRSWQSNAFSSSSITNGIIVIYNRISQLLRSRWFVVYVVISMSCISQPSWHDWPLFLAATVLILSLNPSFFLISKHYVEKRIFFHLVWTVSGIPVCSFLFVRRIIFRFDSPFSLSLSLWPYEAKMSLIFVMSQGTHTRTRS